MRCWEHKLEFESRKIYIRGDFTEVIPQEQDLENSEGNKILSLAFAVNLKLL
jgi:hypothetical protein